MESQNGIVSGLFWKLLERFGVQAGQFVLQLVLARLLDPSHYGVLSMMLVFTNLANIFVQSGLNTSLIQKKNTDERDFSSVFWTNITMAVFLCIVLFFAAPVIADFYNMPEITAPFRVLTLALIPGGFNSVQIAKVSRDLDFKKIFRSNLLAIIISGGVGIALALLGAGLWALVVQYILNLAVACIVMWFTVKWRPHFIFDFERFKRLFGFGWKLLVSNLINTLYMDLNSLFIGKQFTSSELGYFNRGKQFPSFLVVSLDSAVQSVMLPSMSSRQDNRSSVKSLMRNSIIVCTYLVLPMMAGLAAVASPLVSLLLTDKWLPCVPYIQAYCFTFAFYPIHSCNLQAINAVGRSDIYLKLEIIKKTIGVIALLLAVFVFKSVMAIALSGCVTTLTSCFINAYPNKKLINYSYFEQMRDMLPPFVVSLIMCGIVLLIGTLKLPTIVLLGVQMLSGIVIYLGLSYIFKLKGLTTVIAVVKNLLNKKKSKA